MRRKRSAMFFLIFLMLMSGCANQFSRLNYDDKEKIISEYNTFGLFNAEQNISDNRFVCEVKFDGMDVIWSYEAEQDEDVEISYLFNVIEGKAKLVLILPDNTIVTLIEKENETESEKYSTSLHLQKGDNRIKLVTQKGTNVEFDISIPVGSFHKLGL